VYFFTSLGSTAGNRLASLSSHTSSGPSKQKHLKSDILRFESWDPSQLPRSLPGGFPCSEKRRHFRRLAAGSPVSGWEFWAFPGEGHLWPTSFQYPNFVRVSIQRPVVFRRRPVRIFCELSRSVTTATRAPAGWRPGRHSLPAPCQHAKELRNGGMPSRAAAAYREESPPLHRRDCRRRSLARANPAGRGKPTCVYENVRLAMPVGDLEGDVFFHGRTFDRFPTIIFQRRRHSPFPSSERRASVCAATTSLPQLSPCR
jgi:hypothetical protein